MQMLCEEFQIIEHINRILNGNDLQMIDQVIWLIANSVGESSKLQSLIVSKTYIIEGLTRIITEARQCQASLMKGLLCNIIWCVSNISRHKTGRDQDQQQFQLTEQESHQLLYIVQQFMNITGISVSFTKDTLWSLSYLLERGNDDFCTSVCKGKKTMEILINSLKSPLQEESVPAMRAIGQILSSDNGENVDMFLFHGGLGAL